MMRTTGTKVRLQRERDEIDLQEKIGDRDDGEDRGEYERHSAARREKENGDKAGRERSKDYRPRRVSGQTQQRGDHEPETESDQHARGHQVHVLPPAADPPGRRARETECDEEIRAGVRDPERREQEGPDGEKDGAPEHATPLHGRGCPPIHRGADSAPDVAERRLEGIPST